MAPRWLCAFRPATRPVYRVSRWARRSALQPPVSAPGPPSSGYASYATISPLRLCSRAHERLRRQSLHPGVLSRGTGHGDGLSHWCPQRERGHPVDSVHHGGSCLERCSPGRERLGADFRGRCGAEPPDGHAGRVRAVESVSLCAGDWPLSKTATGRRIGSAAAGGVVLVCNHPVACRSSVQGPNLGPVARWCTILSLVLPSIGCGNPTSVDDYWIYRVRGVVRDEASAVVPGALVRVEAFAGVCPPASGTPPQSAFTAGQNGNYLAAIEWRGAFDGCVRITAAHPGGASSGTALIERQGVSLASPQTDSLIVDLILHRP